MIEIVPDAGMLDIYADLSARYSLGFEYNDFFQPDLLDSGEELGRRIALYKELKRPAGLDTLHGAFFDIVPFSRDSGIRRHSLYRMEQSMEIAEELGCRGVVFHTGLMPGLVMEETYRKDWLGAMADTFADLLRKYPGLEIYCENMFDESPNELAELSGMLKEEARFGVCLDVGHMMLATDKPEEWLQKLAPYIRHFHLNDNHLKYDEHLALGDGSIRWKHIFALFEQYGLTDRSMLLEVLGRERVNRSLEYISKLARESGVQP